MLIIPYFPQFVNRLFFDYCGKEFGLWYRLLKSPTRLWNRGLNPCFVDTNLFRGQTYHPCPDLVKNGVQTPSNAAYTVLTPLLYLGLPKYKAWSWANILRTKLRLYTSRYTLMYRGKNPSRNSVGHFDPLKMTDEIKKSMGQNDPLIFGGVLLIFANRQKKGFGH